ncbi:hypothetical protein ACFPES_18385 [Paenibacillus sp. GCM10023248]|uniref:hypothetical protein n=1 Tax=Bacillales TaxID=1385 RepID=UPI002378CA3D|nr:MULTISPECIES: hypothetical protein [Bacillales]MDD9269015.1 hypothetical protein [Paenibacillus sp. MAHUQ-63]MDR6884985.1 hypothetical protein [Bacillus sp. 3255]
MKTVNIAWIGIALFFLTAIGVSANELLTVEQPLQPTEMNPVVIPYSPEVYGSTAQFEYEFEWLGGKIEANPQ